jgi:uncharacterized protein (TIGR03435 family)
MKSALAALLLSLASLLPAQSRAPGFEVASVKLNPTFVRGVAPVHFGSDSVRLTFVDLSIVLILAYSVRDFQIAGPEWLHANTGGNSFNVDAKASHPVPEAQLRLMLRPLLADRFHLSLHHEQKEMPVIAMRQARSGAKVTSPADGVQPNTQWLGFAGVLWTGSKFINATAESLAAAVGACTGGALPPVIDQTGLKGRFDFVPPPIRLPPAPDGSALADEDRLAACNLLTQQNVGITLTRTKAPVDILVIDHADKVPTEN